VILATGSKKSKNYYLRTDRLATRDDENEANRPESGPQGAEEQDSLLGSLTRRSFLAQLGAAGVAATASPLAALGEQSEPGTSEGNSADAPEAVPITLKINGHTLQTKVEARVTLLDALRERLGLPGTKKGCDHGQCGACTVHINGRRVNSCLTLAIMHQNDEITTIEGLAENGRLSPVQQAFVDHDGFQCGYCTPGQIMSATAVLNEPWWGTDDASTREAMYGNICRCGAYNNIVAAVQQARAATRKS
jgi:xanthine dehydrogenase YagT iron-sulfur-binding subunit